MASINIDFTDLSFDEIKDSLKTVLKNDGIITDFEYEGSNTDTLLNVLSYVGTLINHNINYMAGESFLSTARNRKNILKHANALNYTVERKISALLKVNLSFTLSSGRSLTIPKNTEFYTDDNTTFLTQEELTFVNSNNTSKTFNKTIILKEGTIIDYTKDQELRFTYNQYEHNTILLKYTDIEDKGITIYADNDTFVESDNIMDDILAGNTTFMTQYDPDTEYVRVKFLNKYGIAPADGSDIKIQLLISKGAKGNNYKKLNPIVLSDRSTDPNVTLENEISIFANVGSQNASYSGADEETNEEIQLYAPLSKSTSNRYITALDWEAGLVNLPQISNASVWGGDELGTDLELSGFDTYQKESLKKPGYVFMTGTPSDGSEYFSINTIEDIKEIMRENSVVSLRKKFLQPIYVGFDLQINVEKDINRTDITFDDIESQIIDITNDFYKDPFGLHFKKAKLINAIYNIDGVDSIDLDGTKIAIGISGVNFYDDSVSYLDVNLPISKINSPILTPSISSAEPWYYDFRLQDIVDDENNPTEYDYNPSIDTFLDHLGIMKSYYLLYDVDTTYFLGDYVRNGQGGELYICTVTESLGVTDITSSNNWKMVEETSRYMDRWHNPIDFKNYKRIILEHKDGYKFTEKIQPNDYYNENDLVWSFDSSTGKIRYYLSTVSNNQESNLSDSNFWQSLDVSASVVAEGELVIGTYMMEENLFRLSCTAPRKLNVEITNSYKFDATESIEFLNLAGNGINTNYSKGDIISYNNNTYICRFDITTTKWDTNLTYVTGDLVFDENDTFYISLVDSNSANVPSTSTDDWEEVPLWDSLETYNIDDIVYVGNYCYKCIKTISNDMLENGTVQFPTTNQKYWEILHTAVNPGNDTNYDVWVPYVNDYKFNTDIFDNSQSATGTSDAKRLIYLDDNPEIALWNGDSTYNTGDLVIYPDYGTGYLYKSKLDGTTGLSKLPTGRQSDNDEWDYISKTTNDFDMDNLKFKKELKTSIKTRTINFS